MTYSRAGDGLIIIDHTEVPAVLRGRKVGERLVRQAIEDARRDGVAIIHRQLQDILARMGLTEVESEGKPFDPHIHEAVSQVETDEHPEGTVLSVFQKGYLFKDRLLRPAMVNVARSHSGGGEVPGPAGLDSEAQSEALEESD